MLAQRHRLRRGRPERPDAAGLRHDKPIGAAGDDRARRTAREEVAFLRLDRLVSTHGHAEQHRRLILVEKQQVYP